MTTRAAVPVSDDLLTILRSARTTLDGCAEPEAIVLTCRCDRLLQRIQQGRYTTHCEISTELRAIIDDTEELLHDV